eukprot:1019178-Prymnesium_polylepis.1
MSVGRSHAGVGGRIRTLPLGSCMTLLVTVPSAVAVTEPCDAVGGGENFRGAIMRIPLTGAHTRYRRSACSGWLISRI